MISGESSRPQPSPSELLVQRFLVDAPPTKRPLYWRMKRQGLAMPQVTLAGRGELIIGENTTLSFDTYFNAFFEGPWRRNTRISTLTLRLELEGDCVLRVFRRATDKKVLIEERSTAGPLVEMQFDDQNLHFRQQGLLSLEVTSRGGPVHWHSGEWICRPAARSRVGLALVFCTFNRESDISRILARLCSDTRVLDRLSRIYVVNQGRPFSAGGDILNGISRQLGAKLRILEQKNYGGAGGFGRGLLACLDDPDVTHVALLDDDIDVEPECLLRMASFFELAKSDVVVGGQMLDALHPTRLYEAGAIISERHWAFQPQFHNLDLATPDNLTELSQPFPIHYNGWWCCGIPLSLIRQVGLPLPCFIRGDDLELGLRLHQQGVPTVSFPGIAVWHQPFYLKLGGWQLYYETRNMLIAASLHQPSGRWGVVRRMTRHLLVHLLTFRYYSAALILQGIDDFLSGPTILHGSPLQVHASLERHRTLHPATHTSREQVVYEQPKLQARPLRGRASYLWALTKLLAHHFTAPTRDAPLRLLSLDRFNWPTMQGVEHVAVETWWDDALPTFRRSREDFRRLGYGALKTLWRLYAQGPSAAAAWRKACPKLVSVAFWRNYLNIAETALPAKGIPEVVE